MKNMKALGRINIKGKVNRIFFKIPVNFLLNTHYTYSIARNARQWRRNAVEYATLLELGEQIRCRRK